jgi:hypothetical protein
MIKRWLEDHAVSSLLLCLMWAGCSIGIWYCYLLDSINGTVWFAPLAAGLALNMLAFLVFMAKSEGWLRVSPGGRVPRVGDQDDAHQRVWTGWDWSDPSALKSLPVAQQALNRDMRAMVDYLQLSASPMFEVNADRIRVGLNSLQWSEAEERVMRSRMNAAMRDQQARLESDLLSMYSPGPQTSDFGSLGIAASDIFGTWMSPRRQSPPVVRRADDILAARIREEQHSLQFVTDQRRKIKTQIAKFARFLKGGATIEEIHGERNAELRQAMLEKFGLDRYMAEVGAKVIASDQYGELLEYADVQEHDVTNALRAEGFPTGLLGGSSIAHDWATGRILMRNVRRRVRAVRVLNSTPDWPATDLECRHRNWRHDPDPLKAVCTDCLLQGHFRTYVLRVPPNMQTPRQAIAWTFGLRAEEYQPARMT